MTTISLPRVRSFDVMDVTRSYAERVIEADTAISIIRVLSVQDRHMPLCRHGLHSGARLSGKPACPLCMVEHGYSVPSQEVRHDHA